MNICKRILLLFLLYVVLFAQYSPLHIAYATDDYGIATLNLEDEDYDGKSVILNHSIFNGPNKGRSILNANNIYLTNININNIATIDISDFDISNYFEPRYHLKNVDNSRLFSKGSKVDFTLSGIVHMLDSDTKSINVANSSVHSALFFFRDIDGNWHKSNADSFSFNHGDSSGQYSTNVFSATCNTVPVDAYEIIVSYVYNFSSAYGYGGLTSIGSYKLTSGYYNSKILIEETKDDGTKGLLGSIIQLVTNIKDGVANLPSKIASSIKGFFDNVVSAVVNLGTTILDGIKGLFVPSEEDITIMKDKWEQLLADRFGALYQVVDLIADYVEVFQASEQGTITIPSVSIPLGEANFVFGGWEVQVVPEGFDVLFTALKSIISIVCTVWCVNGLKNRFERIVGGSSNI